MARWSGDRLGSGGSVYLLVSLDVTCGNRSALMNRSLQFVVDVRSAIARRRLLRTESFDRAFGIMQTRLAARRRSVLVEEPSPGDEQ